MREINPRDVTRYVGEYLDADRLRKEYKRRARARFYALGYVVTLPGFIIWRGFMYHDGALVFDGVTIFIMGVLLALVTETRRF